MKDAYSLHLSNDGLATAYDEQAAAYHRIFQRVGLQDVAIVESATGLMGGQRAHEFMCFLDVGEDVVVVCDACGFAANREVLSGDAACRVCGGRLTERRGVEVGNIFQLGTRYTDALGVYVIDAKGQRRSVIMGSYGIGVSRLLACLVERFHDERGIALPTATSALDVHIVVLGRDRDLLDGHAACIERDLASRGLDVLWDDRGVSAGEQLADADLIGAQLRVALGAATTTNHTVEIRERRTGLVHTVPLDGAVDHISKTRSKLLAAS